MPDIYSQIQKKKNKKKEQDEADKLIDEHCRQLEEEDYNMAKMARQKLSKTAQEQHEITKELKKQGEQLSVAEDKGRLVHKHAREGSEVADKIKDEGHLFKVPFLGKIKKVFTGEKDEDQIVTKNKSHENLKDESSSEIEKQSHDGRTGNNKTDKELLGIYNTLKGMKKENINQQDEISKQKKTMKNISAYSKDSDAILSRTNKKLKKL